MRTAYKIQDFVCNLLLTGLVVFQGQFVQQVLGVVGSRLHCYGAGGVFSCG